MRFLFLLVVVWVCAPGLREGIAQTLERPNRVLHLDSRDSYVQLPGGIFDSLEAATVEAWVRWDDWNYFSQWFSFGADEQWRAMGVNHFERFTTLQFFIYPDMSPRVLRAETNLALGQWCHMAAVSGPGGMRFYLNGVLLGHNGYEGSFAALGGGTHLYLGKSNWAANYFFRGRLDEVRVWSEARSQAQIRAAMGQRLRGDEPGLVGLWNFDGAAAADESPSGHHGHLQGDAHTVSAPFPGTGEIALPAVVRGTLRGEDGMPRVNAVVRLRNARGDSVSMWTREDGHYALAVFGEGAYTLDVVPKSALMPPQEVQLQAGETLRRHLRPSTGVVARWSAEGDAHDEVGGHHGTLMGDATFASGVVGQAFHLDGVDDYVLVPNAPALNPKGSFSLAAWVFPTTADSGSIVNKWGSFAEWGLQGAYHLKIDPELRIGFYISDDVHQGDITFIGFESPPRVIALNTWNHVAAVYDQSTGERRVYVNGTLVAQRIDSPITLTDSHADFVIGARIHGTMLPGHTAPFAGRIDEVSVHDRALSESEIQRLYGAHVQARWPAEGNANDATRGGNDGVLVHPVAFAPGVVGQAFAFGGQEGYVEFPSPVGHVGTADFTAELWLWRTQQDAGRQPLLVKYRNENNALEVHLDAEGRVQVALSSSGDIRSLASKEWVSAQSWHHLTLVRRGGDLGLYIDGRLDTLQTSSVAVDVVLLAPLLLGGSSWHERSFAGHIDEVAWHDRALSAAEILTVHQTHMRTWYWHQWSGRLQVGGVGLVALVALVYSVRYYIQRKASETERRGREAQLAEERRAREIADAANQAKSAFLANMSHEIRTPMNAILGYAQILRNHPVLSPQQQQHAVEAIYTSGDHLLELINDVLDLSKIEAGRMELQPIDFDLARLIDDLAAMFQVHCQQQDLGWRIEQEGDEWDVHGDENKLRQVLVNLLGNAVKFTRTGEVVLRIKAQAAESYSFEVQDTGPGIPPQQQETIFEPFQQGETNAQQGGTGLGLAIARRHVELMGGHLQLDSSLEQGARFFFSLALPPAQGPVAEETETRYRQVVQLAAGYVPKILIVDDVLTNREILVQMLERIGAQIRQVDSGQAALAAVHQQQPDLVFMDIRMPGMDGVEALRRIRQKHAALPIVAISASVMQHEQQHYLASGFDAFLDKPFRLEDLYACLEQVLDLSYEYAQPSTVPAPEPADFDGLRLPAALRAQLHQAAEMHNVTEVKNCLAQVQALGAEEAHLAAHLGELVQRYDLESVLKILEKTDDA